jgi:tetratricopeptide (TPR) repeat protein
MPAIARGASDPFQSDIPANFVDRLENAKTKRIAGDIDQALQELSTLVQEQPGYYRAMYNLGLTMADAAGKDPVKLNEAITILERARDLREKQSLKDYSIYNSLGWYYTQTSRSDEAEKAYTIALNHTSANSAETNRRLFTNLGLFYLERGDLDLAQKYLQIAAEKYQSETARKFLEINETVRNKTEISEELSYRARLSDKDKANSKGVKFVDEIRQKEGAESAVLETLLQDRANYYHYGKRDKEDEPSPGLERTTKNRIEFLKRKLKFVELTANECLDQQPVVAIAVKKDSIQVSKLGP